MFSAQVQRGQSFILRSLCCVCICRNSLDPISPSTELLVPVVIHVPPLWLVFLLCSTAHHAVAAPSLDPQNRGRSNSFLPSGVLNWLLNFLKIPFQITSFFLLTFCPSPPVTKAPRTFYSGIFHQTCLLNLSICHSEEVVLSRMLKNTWYCSTNNTIQTHRHPSPLYG